MLNTSSDFLKKWSWRQTFKDFFPCEWKQKLSAKFNRLTWNIWNRIWINEFGNSVCYCYMEDEAYQNSRNRGLLLGHHCAYHCSDVIMGTVASQITSLTIVYSTIYSGADQRIHQSSASLAFVRGIHRGPVNSLHKWSVTRKMFPFDDVIMQIS